MARLLNVDVRLDIQQARAAFKGLEKKVNAAAAVALQRVGTTARKEADQEIRKRLTLRSATVKEALAIRRLPKRLIVEITASGKPIALKEYRARKTKKGATFQVAKRNPRRVYLRQNRPGFIVDRLGGHVYVRTGPNPPGPETAKIKKVYGPSIPQYFVTRFVRERMMASINERWPIEFSRQLKYRMSSAAA